MTNYETFVNAPKSLIIAPAGYGKTHTISESLKHTKGKQLILTHTHAGISSIKEKLKKANISSQDYNVETITSFAQKYVLSFYSEDDIPEQDDKTNYFPFIIQKAQGIFKLKAIKKIINISYTGLFVDEYQDCTESQHNIILELSNILPTHILGDYLQGIFDFNPQEDPIINLKDTEKLKDFYENFQELETPWRWKIGGNEILGQELKEIRDKLKLKESINLNNYPSIDFIQTDDIYSNDPKKEIFKIIKGNESLLIIDPISTSPYTRISFIQRFMNSCTLLESIDEKKFYDLSKKLDLFKEDQIYKNIIDFGLELFNKTKFKVWFNADTYKLINKRDKDSQNIINSIKELFDKLEKKRSYYVIAELLLFIYKIPDIKVYRKDLFFSIIKSMRVADSEGILVYDAMVNSRNLIRRVGNRIEGRCVGTTLLTKGLEFDTVLIINAQKFNCPKNFYVAITRASKKLIIFSENNILSPY